MISYRRFSAHFSHTLLPAALSMSPVAALAEPAAQGTPGVSAEMMLQTALGLALILGLLFLAAYLLRRLNGGRGFGGKGPLRVIGGLMISTRERIVVVEVGDTWLVVGIGPGQIRTLHTMLKGETTPFTADEKPFGQWLKQVIERKNENK